MHVRRVGYGDFPHVVATSEANRDRRGRREADSPLCADDFVVLLLETGGKTPSATAVNPGCKAIARGDNIFRWVSSRLIVRKCAHRLDGSEYEVEEIEGMNHPLEKETTTRTRRIDSPGQRSVRDLLGRREPLELARDHHSQRP